MNHCLAFTIPGKPAAQGSKRHLGNGVMVESCRRIPGWRSDARTAATLDLPDDWPLDRPMLVTMAAFFARPKSHTIGGRNEQLTKSAPAYPGRVGDIDKIARALLDALTYVLWLDDAQVVELDCLKRYAQPGEPACVVVRVRALEFGHPDAASCRSLSQ